MDIGYVASKLSWRKGQTLFNFLEWLRVNKQVIGNQNVRMADPFHLSDEEFNRYLEEFLEEQT